MLGINIEILDNIINNSESQIDSSIANLNRLIEVAKELNNCYYGSDIQFLFNGTQNIEQKIKGIKAMLQSYPKILRSVKTSYIKQDKIFSDEVRHIISKI